MDPNPSLDLEQARADIEEAMAIVERFYVRMQAYGESITLADAQPLMERYGYLFEDETIAAADQYIQQFTADGNPDEVHRVRMMKSKALFYRGMISTIAMTLSLNQAEAVMEIPLSDGTVIPYRVIQSTIENEEDRARRQEMDDQWYEADEKLNMYYKPMVETHHFEAKSLGYASFYDMARELNDVDYPRLETQMQEFLARTKDLYRTVFGQFLADKLGISIEDATRADLERLRRGFWLDESRLTPDQMLALAGRVFADMGIPWGPDVPGLTLDLEDRPKKVERAFCAAPRVPTEIILVCKPRGGFEDFQTFFHESGHAVHMSNIAADLPIEYRSLGAPSITEVVAFLMEGLMEEPAVLQDYLGLNEDDAHAFAEYGHFMKLWFLRSYAARFAHEVRLHQDTSGDLEQYRQQYVDLLSEAHQYPMKSARFLQGDYGFYSADYLMAWLFEIQLRNLIKNQFGENWWQDRDAGQFLIDNYFRLGDRYTLKELAERLGFDVYDINPIIQQFAA